MRAAMYRGPGKITIEDVPEPGDPGPGELLIAVGHAAICGTDATEWTHGPLLAKPPVVLGHEFVGRVVACGEGVDGIAVNDRAVCGSGVSCGQCVWCRQGRTNLCDRYYTIGLHADGGLAEQVRVPAAVCRVVPNSVSDVAAAMAQPLAVALHAVRRSTITESQSCVVLGVGGIGAFCLAGAKEVGAAPLIAVDVDDGRLQTAKKLGADVLIDARSADVVSEVLAATGGEGAAVVLEATGIPTSPDTALRCARRGGSIVAIGLQSAPVTFDLFRLSVQEVDLHGTLAHVCAVDLDAAIELLMGNPGLADVVLDRVIDLENLVDGGIRRLAEREATGKIVVRVGTSG